MKPQRHFQEFEHEMDVLSLTFGAALGGYVGVVIATEDVSTSDMWFLMILLANVGGFLLAVRQVAKAIFRVPYFGFKFWGSLTSVFVLGASAQMIAMGIPLASEKFSIILRGWAAALAFYLFLAYFRMKQWNKD